MAKAKTEKCTACGHRESNHHFVRNTKCKVRGCKCRSFATLNK